MYLEYRAKILSELRSLGCSIELSAAQVLKKDEALQGKFVALSFHFVPKPKLNLSQFYRVSFSLACTNGQMVDS